MSNFHSNQWIENKLQAHWEEALTLFPQERIVGLFLQGSQNYGLDYEDSDIDTKLIVTPSFEDIAMNHKPVSTTHVRENGEHIDLKDIRLYMQTFRKQNLNFVEILFTPYFIVNKSYAKEWNRLVQSRKDIARYHPVAAVKSMKNIAMEKYHAMEYKYPSKMEILAKYGYDGKQLHHLLRVMDFLQSYIRGDMYEDCLRPLDPEWLVAVKKNRIPLADARKLAESAINHVIDVADNYCLQNFTSVPNPEVDKLLDDVQLNIMRLAMKGEFV